MSEVQVGWFYVSLPPTPTPKGVLFTILEEAKTNNISSLKRYATVTIVSAS